MREPLKSRSGSSLPPGVKKRKGVEQALHRKVSAVKLFLCDVDGVLTDASVFMGQGLELKRFNIRDGLGLRMLQRHGIKVGWISNRPSQATTQRAQDLEMDFLHQRDGNKVEAVQAILEQTGLNWSDVCYMGDDVVDLGAISRAVLGVAPSDAIDETRRIADYVTAAPGGHGAVREVVELILKVQNKWDRLIQDYSS